MGQRSVPALIALTTGEHPTAAASVRRTDHPDLIVALGALLERAIEAQRADFGAIRLALKAAPARPGSFALPAEIARMMERSTHAYALRRRAEQAQPEQMLVEIKQVLREIDAAVPIEFRRDVSSDLIRWAIEAYYA